MCDWQSRTVLEEDLLLKIIFPHWQNIDVDMHTFMYSAVHNLKGKEITIFLP